ncbi:protein AAR2 homolog isoform X2 [Dysidea avara]|uniref:protein AAR2 homolog isoform X2 n=1 Tax=Dysidea avara TaxID=196820 RepID=UPI00332B800A
MDQCTAHKLFAEGAFLVMLDVPQNTEIGIDYHSWRSGPKFMGIKMIPPGLHFVYYSAVNSNGQAAPRTGLFHSFKKQEVLVYRWDVTNEDVTTDGVTMEMVDRITSGIKDLDNQLGCYPYESLKIWYSLTNHIREPLLKRLQPIKTKISSVMQLVSSKQDHMMQGVEQDHMITGGTFAGVGEFPSLPAPTFPVDQCALVADTDASIRFTSFPTHKHPQGSSPSDITRHHMDLTYTLSTMLDSCYDNMYEAFNQWKKLICLLCSCEEAIAVHTDLYSNFIGVLHFQLKHTPDDFFIDNISKDNFVTVSLKNFFSNLEECPGACKDLVSRGLQFRDTLAKKYSWDFNSELDEFAPTVID